MCSQRVDCPAAKMVQHQLMRAPSASWVIQSSRMPVESTAVVTLMLSTTDSCETMLCHEALCAPRRRSSAGLTRRPGELVDSALRPVSTLGSRRTRCRGGL